MREIGVDELLADRPPPFVRYQLADAPPRRAWRRGAALVVQTGPGRRFRADRQYVALGPATDLAPLLDELARREPAPQRLSLEDVELTPPWPHQVLGHWRWMWTDVAPPPPALPVLEVHDPEEVNALLDAGNPTSWARPGEGTVEVWLGVRERDRLLAVGSVSRSPSGVGHLLGVTVHPDHRGRGLGSAVSAALTRHAQSRGPGVATLGVYAANTAAVRTYLGLGYLAPHTFRSGPIDTGQGSERDITRASEPSG